MKKHLKVTLLTAVFFVSVMIINTPISAEYRDMTVSAVGDCIILHKISLSKDPRILQLADILRKADCTYGNCETTFYAPEEGFPSYKDFDPNVFCYPWGADEIQWLGIDIMSLANNHIMDFEYDGMYSTMQNLDRVGIKYAGAGKDLNHASKPGYFESEAGPVALVSCSSWVPEKNHQASLPSAYMKGKPGLNPINLDYIFQLDADHFARLKDVSDSVMKSMGVPLPKEEEGKERTQLEIGLTKFSKGDKIDFVLSPKKHDLDRVLESIKIAKRNARIVIASLHEHEGNLDYSGPSKYQEDFARACIDAGADIFIGTGPHQLWGVEMYKGKPIFYSIGNFFFQMPLPIISPEAYSRCELPPNTIDPILYEEKFLPLYGNSPIFDSVVPFITFDSQNKVKEILLYPIFLDEDKPLFLKGTPRLATPEKAKAIIDHLIEKSKRYNTGITFRKGVGEITL